MSTVCSNMFRRPCFESLFRSLTFWIFHLLFKMLFSWIKRPIFYVTQHIICIKYFEGLNIFSTLLGTELLYWSRLFFFFYIFSFVISMQNWIVFHQLGFKDEFQAATFAWVHMWQWGMIPKMHFSLKMPITNITLMWSFVFMNLKDVFSHILCWTIFLLT